MAWYPKNAGWTENLKPLEPPEDAPETPAARAVSYSAMVLLVALVLGLAVLAFPYVMALVSSDADSRHHSYRTPDNTDFWIKGDTKAKAGCRFAAGALTGASLAIAYLVFDSYRRSQ